MTAKTILLVEDEAEVRDLLTLYLDKHGFRTIVAEDGSEALQLFESALPDLVLLDIGLPGLNGLQVCEQIRSYSNVPIILISCNQEPEDIVHGLAIGADDYITKPFDPAVVVARVQASLRRAPLFRRPTTAVQAAKPSAKLSFGNLTIDLNNYEVWLNGEPVVFPAKELQLLIFLAQNPDHIFTLEDLYTKVWGAESNGDLRTVMVHLSNIRKKIEPNAVKPRWIHNVRGFGYKFSSRQSTSRPPS